VKLEVVEPVGGLRALLDAKLLRVVTMHLLENAMQHTQEGRITLSYYVKEGGFYVEVRDTGTGLPEELKANIFALLSDKNTYLQDQTPGLGLSICKAIIDRSGGKIGAQDNEEDGHGTIFWFWTPVKILN
jgi:signal transduction histidine kinase